MSVARTRPVHLRSPRRRGRRPVAALAVALAASGLGVLGAAPVAAAPATTAPATMPAASVPASRPAVAPAPDVVAKTGSSGAIVSAIDRALRRAETARFGRPTRSGAPALVYGPETTKRVQAFQRWNRLRPTGIVDEATDGLLRPRYTLQRGTQLIARSVQGRPITAQVVGDPRAKKRVIVVGCIHGNECAGRPILSAIATGGAPAGVAYVLVPNPNPDGAAAGTRQNAHQVDLNRNFVGWKPNGASGFVYYPGPGALSEPESLALYDLVRATRPTAYVTYHQALRVVDYAGSAGARMAPGYAARSGLPVSVLPAYAGSNGTWLGTRYPDVATLTVELSRPVPAAMITRNIAALRWLATHH